MKKETFTLSVADTNENNAFLKLTSTFGEKSVAFTIFDNEGKSCATTVAPFDVQKIVDYLNNR